MSGELAIVYAIQTFFVDHGGTFVILLLARWLIFVMVIALALFSYVGTRAEREQARQALWSLMIALIISLLLSEAFGRLRPFVASPEIALIIPAPASTHSFPSSHTAAVFAIAFSYLSGRRSRTIIAFVAACLVALGRIAGGVHYPTDVLGGLVVGLIGSLVARSLFRSVEDSVDEERRVRHKKAV